MYCIKCGKFIEYDALICKECEEALNKDQVNQEPINQEVIQNLDEYEYKKSSKGLTAGIMSVVVGGIDFTFASISFFLLIIGVIDPTLRTPGIVTYLICVLCSGLSLFLGIYALVVYKKEKEINYETRPVATCVLGVIGVVIASIMIFYVIYMNQLIILA